MNAKTLEYLVRTAARGREPIVWGKALGPSPKFFVVGDEPVAHDFVTGEPFSGQLSEILASTLQTLEAKYGARPEDCYITYFVKVKFLPGDLTEDMFIKEWLPALQLEFALSGCSDVVALTPAVQHFAGHIPNAPASLKRASVPLAYRLKRAWEVISG